MNIIPTITTTIPAEESACSDKEPFALMVLGEDMMPEFVEGAVITVDPGHPLLSGTFVVADVDGEITFRQYFRKDDKEYLRGLQPKSEQLLPSEWELKGVVVQSYKKRVTAHYQYPRADEFVKHERVRGKRPKSA